jgi:hypothetical protein
MIKGKDINPIGFLGNSVKVHLKLGGAFYLKVTTGKDYLSGYDQEGFRLMI